MPETFAAGTSDFVLTALCAEMCGFLSGSEEMSGLSCSLAAADRAFVPEEVGKMMLLRRCRSEPRVASQYQQVHSE